MAPLAAESRCAATWATSRPPWLGRPATAAGEAKNTYGTGCFMLLNTGTEIVPSKSGLLTTLAYKLGDRPAVYALEGSIAITGALVQWLRDNLGLFDYSHHIEDYASSVPDSGGIYFVPAFSGLFAPHWRSDARGVIVGLTRYVNKNHIARAALEATAYQTREVLDAMEQDSGVQVDGPQGGRRDGPQRSADAVPGRHSGRSRHPAHRGRDDVLGAAYAAGLAVGFWDNLEDLRDNWGVDKTWRTADERRKARSALRRLEKGRGAYARLGVGCTIVGRESPFSHR